ncbi:WhiB family transcriptional regulator [Streptosporangium algeriense]|uniref:Transcriptional regulator WhiB n=1 Tax=Streptosporangium algeriense TaxID=1682748 RepID=A0ABW3DK00_9ACTN
MALPRPGWWTEAGCIDADPELFYPPQGGSPRVALRICRSCPVSLDCFAYSMARGEIYGVWGGTTEGDRRRLRAGGLRTGNGGRGHHG